MNRSSDCCLARSALLSVVATAAEDRIVVASKIDTEGALLGNMILEMLEARGLPVENKHPARADQHRACRHTGRARSTSIPNIPATARLFFQRETESAWKNSGAVMPRSESSTREESPRLARRRRRPTTPG